MDNIENKNTGTDTQEQENKTYSEAELQSLIDQRVTQALSTQKKKFDKEKSDAIEEAKRVATMDEQQKKEYELAQKQKELDDKIKELNFEKSKNEASKLLNDNKLSLELLDFVVADDSETMKSNVDKLSKVFNSAVNAAASERLSSNNPKRSEPTQSAVTKEAFSNMSMSERQALFTSNPEVYNQLTGHNN